MQTILFFPKRKDNLNTAILILEESSHISALLVLN